MSARPEGVPAAARPNRFPQGYTFWVVGAERAVLRDAYHTFLRLRWGPSLLLIGVGLLLANLPFAVAYKIAGGVEGGAHSFFDMYSFSMQTMATIGYGAMHPTSVAAETIMIVEAIFGIILVALCTGLVFTKFARATARVAFSKHAVIGTHEGRPTLMFRIGNRRSNVIVEAQLHVSISLLTTTAEGRTFYKLHDLPLVRDRMGGLRRGWIVMHAIDESSPLHGLDAAALQKREAEVEISLLGFDDVTMQNVHSAHTYADGDIKLGYRLADTITTLKNGDLVLDLTRFDMIEPDSRASVAA
jgi:inward rectifier potassium channel